MPSSARKAFEENRTDVERLIEIHGELTGEGPRYRHGSYTQKLWMGLKTKAAYLPG